MIQKQMQFHGPLRLAKLGPIKKARAKLDHRGVQAEKLVAESKLSIVETQLLTTAQKLVKHLLVQLPRPMLIGVGQRRSFRRPLEAQMLRFSKTTGQTATDLPQRMGLPQLAKSMATNWSQQLNPLAPRSDWVA